MKFVTAYQSNKESTDQCVAGQRVIVFTPDADMQLAWAIVSALNLSDVDRNRVLKICRLSAAKGIVRVTILENGSADVRHCTTGSYLIYRVEDQDGSDAETG